MRAPHLNAALLRLHQVRVFFAGFAAGRDPARDETRGQHLAAEHLVSSAAEFLAHLEDGRWRTVLPGVVHTHDGSGILSSTERRDGGRFLVSFAELERIADGLRMESTADDLRLANSAIKLIMRQVESEQKAILDESHSRDWEIPF